MSAASTRRGLGVDWHLPNRRGGYAKRPFVSTTRADSDMIVLLAEQGLTWSQVKVALCFPSREQLAVVDRFIAEGYGHLPAARFVA